MRTSYRDKHNLLCVAVFSCFTLCMSVAKKRKVVDAPAASDETLPAPMLPPLPPGMLVVEDQAAREKLIALDQLSREDKLALWQRLRRDLPEFANQMSVLAKAFGGKVGTLDLRGFDPALHADFKARQNGAPTGHERVEPR